MIKPAPKTALITGITGQDFSYLAELVLEKGYKTQVIKLYAQPQHQRNRLSAQDPDDGDPFFTHYGDLTDNTNLIRIFQKVQPDETCNFGAQSNVSRFVMNVRSNWRGDSSWHRREYLKRFEESGCETTSN